MRKDQLSGWLEKTCKGCFKLLPLQEFYKPKNRGYRGKCKRCMLDYKKHIYVHKTRIKLPKEETRIYIRERTGERTEYHRFKAIKQKYGLTADAFKVLLNAQYNCPICKVDFNLLPVQDIVIDHDHKTGKVRGILCRKCNLGLGHFKDKAENCLAAHAYLVQNA